MAALLRDHPLRSIPPTALRLWAPPSNVPEGGHGPRRRQPPAHAALQKYNSYSSNNQRNSYYFYETVAKIGFKSYNPNDNLLLPLRSSAHNKEEADPLVDLLLVLGRRIELLLQD